MRSFREILSELGEALDAKLAGETTVISNPGVFNIGLNTIGTAFIEGKNYSLYINKESDSSYLYQEGNPGERLIGRTKGFLDQSFVKLSVSKSDILSEISKQQEGTGGFWYNPLAPKI